MFFDREWWLAVTFVVLAAIGGLLGSVIRMMEKESENIRWMVVGVETLASAFSGLIVMLLCQSLGFSLQTTGVIVGVCGWGGGRGTMMWMEDRVRRIIQGDTNR